MEQRLGEDIEDAMKALTKNGIPRGAAKKVLEIAEKGTLCDLRPGRCPDAARGGVTERGRPDRRGREGVGPPRPRGLTTIRWWLPAAGKSPGPSTSRKRPACEPRERACKPFAGSGSLAVVIP